jgi:hypothetical protein
LIGPVLVVVVAAATAAAGKIAAEGTAIALVSGQVIAIVVAAPPSPQIAQVLMVVVIRMVGAGVSVHPQWRLVMVVVIVVRPCSHTSQTSIQVAARRQNQYDVELLKPEGKKKGEGGKTYSI